MKRNATQTLLRIRKHAVSSAQQSLGHAMHQLAHAVDQVTAMHDELDHTMAASTGEQALRDTANLRVHVALRSAQQRVTNEEASVEQARVGLQDRRRDEEVVGSLLEAQQAIVHQDQKRAESKRLDEVAAQGWRRRYA